MKETSRLLILISAYEGGVGYVYSQSRGRGQRKIFCGSAPDPEIFCPPPIKIPGGATGGLVEVLGVLTCVHTSNWSVTTTWLESGVIGKSILHIGQIVLK